MRGPNNFDMPQRRSFTGATVLLLVCFAATVGCSSTANSPSETVTGSYFQNPDQVWAAILEVLVDLNYLVDESNRMDGTLRMAPQELDSGAEIVLSIDQVMQTSDQVKVYIKPANGSGEVRATPAELEAAAKNFLALLNKELSG